MVCQWVYPFPKAIGPITFLTHSYRILQCLIAKSFPFSPQTGCGIASGVALNLAFSYACLLNLIQTLIKVISISIFINALNMSCFLLGWWLMRLASYIFLINFFVFLSRAHIYIYVFAYTWTRWIISNFVSQDSETRMGKTIYQNSS